MNIEKKMEDQNVKKRPSILFIGSPLVGKRTLLSRLFSSDLEDDFDLSSEVFVQGWTIDTKYYTADVAVWMAHLHDGFSTSSLPNFNQFAALVMVFDMSEPSSLAALKKWVSHTDIKNFDILLCIGNKADLVPDHPGHDEYRRRLQRIENPSASSDEYGILETEGSSLLGNDEPSCGSRATCLDWCMELNIEYVEACASNVDFDKCLSVDGDSQGVERLLGALSAHMWPGMVLKSGNQVFAPNLPQTQESSGEESDYEGEYEILSGGSAELWDDDSTERWVSAPGPSHTSDTNPFSFETTDSEFKAISELESKGRSTSGSSGFRDNGEEAGCEENGKDNHIDDDPNTGSHLELDDLEQLMSEIANMRSGSRLMPDFQRREMAAKLAMRMAAMFGDSSGDEGFE